MLLLADGALAAASEENRCRVTMTETRTLAEITNRQPAVVLDIAAGAIAGELGAEKLIMLSDVNGFYADSNNPLTRLSTIKKDSINNWLQENKIVGGMVPKLQACLHALYCGVLPSLPKFWMEKSRIVFNCI